MKNKITAAVLYKHKRPLKIHNDLILTDVHKHQVLVKIKYSGLCGSQIAEINGYREDKKYLPHFLGHEGCGEVVAVGSSVKKVKEKDKIILSWIKGIGKDAGGKRLIYKNNKINYGSVTTFSTYSLVSENRVFKAPKNISSKHAVLFGCAIPTGLGMLFNELKPKKNKTFLLMGLGGIGSIVLLGLEFFKPKNVVVVDINKNRFNLVKKMGNNYKFYHDFKGVKKIKDLNDGIDFDYALDCSGKVETISASVGLLNNSGKLIFASHPEKNKRIKLDPFDLIKGKKILGSWGGNCKMDKDISRFYSLHKKGKINLNKIHTKIYSLDKINKAIKDMNKGKIVRAIFKH